MESRVYPHGLVKPLGDGGRLPSRAITMCCISFIAVGSFRVRAWEPDSVETRHYRRPATFSLDRDSENSLESKCCT
jgi:hypothetical protein